MKNIVINILRKKSVLYTSALIGIMLALGSCEKEDYREKWVGAYECERNENNSKETVVLYVSTREDYTLNLTEKDIEQQDAWFNFDVEVNSDGTFEQPPFVSGLFHKDSIYVYYFNHSVGSPKYISYNGRKIKK